MGGNEGKSKFGKVSRIIDGANAVKITFLGKALNYLMVLKETHLSADQLHTGIIQV